MTFHIEYVRPADTLYVDVQGSVEIEEAFDLLDGMLDAVRDHDPGHAIVDFSMVDPQYAPETALFWGEAIYQRRQSLRRLAITTIHPATTRATLITAALVKRAGLAATEYRIDDQQSVLLPRLVNL